MFRTRTRAVVIAGIVVATLAPISGAQAQAVDPALMGSFTAPFEEAGDVTCVIDVDGRELCKPAAASMAALPTGRVLYWDALEGTENVNLNALFEAGHKTYNDRTRILDLSTGTPRFRTPSPEDAGANPNGNDSEFLPLVPHDDVFFNDGDLFCSDLAELADGRLIAVGGTDYFAEPYLGEVQGTKYGLVELEGLKASRIFDPYTESWTQTGSMHFGRWYPSLVTMPDGKLFAASGVGKLVKPIYAERPFDSGTNVRQTEIYDPATGEWTLNPDTANRSLPLYPRLHLLPNGHVYYDAAGQVFNPMGQSYDEAFWNIASTYDPSTQRWTDLGVPGLGLGFLPGLPDLPGRNGMLGGAPLLPNLPLDGLPMAGGEMTGNPGFRGSTFSIMLPLRPDDSGRYSRAEFLSAGGILGVTPGLYLAGSSSQVNTVTIDAAGKESLSSRSTGPLNTGRWYGNGVLLPSGEVMVFSGADKDEVVLPGSGAPVTTPEIWSPTTETWRPVATQGRARTYHNTALLLPDGRVLVGGHAPIPMGYAFNATLPGLSPNDGRDQSFEIYSPPYLFSDQRPTIAAGPDRIDSGTTFPLTLGSADEAAAVAADGTVVLMRNTSITHLVDGDQRAVELPIVGRDGATLTVQAPPDPAVAPPGPYLLFANAPTADGVVPSIGKQVFVNAPVPAALAARTALPAAADGKAAPPFVAPDPFATFFDNLADAFGAPGMSVPTQLASDVSDAPQVPSWLVFIAAGLPMAVLTAHPGVRRRRPAVPRSRAG